MVTVLRDLYHISRPTVQIGIQCLQIGTYRSESKSSLLGKRRPPRFRPSHARALPLPCKQKARKRCVRCVPCVDRATQEEPVSRQHVKIKVLQVVLAARQIGEEAPRVIMGAQVDAEQRTQGRRPAGCHSER